MSEAPLIDARAIARQFGHVQALRGADFSVGRGEIVALIGDNGAGKSTLIRILSGIDRPDHGEIFVNGQLVHMNGPQDARSAGIETVYQDLALAPDLNAAANVFLGRELVRPGILGRLGVLDESRMIRQAAEGMAKLGVTIRPSAEVHSLSGGQRQSAAVARAAMWATSAIFMDEPTANLGVVQTRGVIDLIRRVRDAGTAVVIISHNLPQMLDITDRIVILRLGRTVGQVASSATTVDDLISAMMTGVLRNEPRAPEQGRLIEPSEQLGSFAASTEPLQEKRETGDMLGRFRSFFGSQSAALFLALIGLAVFFSVLRPAAFPTIANAMNMATNASVLLVLAVGSTLVILTGGIDLSINGVLVFSGVIAAMAMVAIGGDSPGVLIAGLVCGVAAGTGWGIINGLLVAKARVPALIVTLGTMGMSLGLALLLTRGVDISDIPENLVLTVGSGRLGGIPILVIVTTAVFVIGALVLRFTQFGRYTYAVGSSPDACRRASINVTSHLIKVYMLAGMLSGLAGYLSLARFATTTLSGHQTDNLQVIAGVVIGGTSLFGGSGGMLGTLVGIIIPVMLLDGFVVLGLPPFWQQVAVGAVLIAAVYFDQLRRELRYR
ncbi:MAG: ATP-binding cassette domain-containing protein [Verrucomicrobia bacterium]|nr:ATP-binding cassette domain-containing protein [Verrucomicrobiota bacterium]